MTVYCHAFSLEFGCNKNNAKPIKITVIPSPCCKEIVSCNIKYASTQVPIVSPKILIEITVALIHFNNQLKMVCPKIVAMKANPIKHNQVCVE